MCCLKYEHDNYESAKDELPEVGSRVVTSLGKGKVVGLNVKERKADVRLDDVGKVQAFPFDDVVAEL